jgi:hypothetical protein
MGHAFPFQVGDGASAESGAQREHGHVHRRRIAATSERLKHSDRIHLPRDYVVIGAYGVSVYVVISPRQAFDAKSFRRHLCRPKALRVV